MATKGFDKAIKRLNAMGERCLNPREALQVIGKEARRRHVGYFSANGPPGEPWPELEQSTKKQKAKRGRTRKLVNEGELKSSYSYTVLKNSMRLLNKARQAFFLQGSGVGKKKKKFIVVATNLRKQDPELLKLVKTISGKFLRTGKTG